MPPPLAIAAAFFALPLLGFYLLVRFGWSRTATAANLTLAFLVALAYWMASRPTATYDGVGAVIALALALAPALAGSLIGSLVGKVHRRRMQTKPVVWPPVRGTLTPDRPLADLTWMRVGGPADMLFQPADVEDLAAFLAALPPEVPVFPMGVGSNLIVRDGGIAGVVIRLGRGFNAIDIAGDTVTAGAAALDAHVARKAAEAGLDLTFLRTIPGTIGGAVRMNAGCYGSYTADVLRDVTLVLRDGTVATWPADRLSLAYRQSTLPDGAVITAATFTPPKGDPADLAARMEAQLKKRDETQPTKDRTAGSTFRNPAGYSSTGRADDTHDLKAWKLIEDAGMRGATLNGAQMNPKHANFLTNTGTATAADLESLGEEVRKRVYDSSGITLEWEIMRVGRTTP